MKLFIRNLLLPNLKETILRFPIPIACVLIFTISSFLRINDIVLIGLKNDPTAWFNIPLFCGFFAFVALKLFVENHSISRKQNALLIICVTAFVMYICFTPNVANLLLLLTGLIFILLVAPYIFNDRGESACCYFNTKVAISVFFAFISAIILCGGISLILASVTYLFDVKISGNAYGNTWLIGMSFFAPFYALTGIPKVFTAEEKQYPKGVSFIFSYIVAPLILVYFAILYAYIAKILIAWELPKGKVAYMVTSFGIIGIFTHLFSYPLKETGSLLIRIVQRYFYYALLIPIILLFVGIGTRIHSYGITEERYIIVMLAIWFTASSLYVIFKKTPKLKVILLIIGSMFILSSFGIWGAESVSISNQISRLQTILEHNNLLKDGHIVKAAQEPSLDDQKEISSIVGYISKHRKIDKFKGWFSSDSYINETKDNWIDTTKILQDMGLKYVSPYQKQDTNYFSYFYTYQPDGKSVRSVNVRNFDIYADVGYCSLSNNSTFSKIIENKEFPDKKLELKLVRNGVLEINYLPSNKKVEMDFSQTAKNLQKYGNNTNDLPKDKDDLFILENENNGLKVKAFIKNISGIMKNGEPDISNINIEIAIKYPD